jgi:hypothetical protein
MGWHLGCGGKEGLCVSQQRSTFGAALQLWHIQAAGCKRRQMLLLYVGAFLLQSSHKSMLMMLQPLESSLSCSVRH